MRGPLPTFTRSAIGVGFAAAIPFLVFLGLYAFLSGRGFIADDFEWASSNRIATVQDLVALFARDNGFYRPIVGFTFGVNEFFAGTNPKPYGFTNVVLALLSCWAVGRTARALGLPRSASVVAAVVWLFNPHGINMAVLWLSGRTALLLTLFATLCLAALVRVRVMAASIWLFAALLSKEEAVLIPIVGLVWIAANGPAEALRHRLTNWSLLSLMVAAGYFILRSQTQAMLPMSAPWFYRFSFDPMLISRNVLEYADRSMTFAALSVLVAALIFRQLPWKHAPERQILVSSASLLIGGFAITVFLPVRSSLYACLPSVGAALVAGATIAQMWQGSTISKQRSAVFVMVAVALFVLAPLHASRANRWVSIATFSARAIADIEYQTRGLQSGSRVLLKDDRNYRANASAAFGALLATAVRFYSGREYELWIDPPPFGTHDKPLPCESCFNAVLAVRAGRVVRVQ